jgi:LmbE family N-acetylglucosaminyl deacetylase
LDAVYPDARNPFTFTELLRDENLEAWTVREVWISGGPNRNHYVDVTGTFDRKVAALKAHVSQTAHMEGLEDMLRGWLGAGARQAGFPEGRLAEVFQVVPTA